MLTTSKGESVEATRLVFVACIWFFSSVFSSNTRKDFLTLVYLPATLTVFEFGVCAVLALAFSTPSQRAPPELSARALLLQIAPLSLSQVFMHYLTSFSVSRVPVAYMHTVKAMAPIFTALISWLALGARVSRETLLCLAAISTGVALSSASEMSFELLGCVSALASALAGVLQSLYSKHMLRRSPLSAEALLLHSSAVSCVLLLPVWWQDEAATWTRALRLNTLAPLLVCGAMQYAQSVSAFALLDLVSPLTYSISSTCKRLGIVLASVVYFRSVMTAPNAVGVALAFGGQLLYVVLRAKQAPNTQSS